MGDGRPDRELYRSEYHEVQQEMAHHYRDKDMKDDYASFIRVKTKEEIHVHRAEFRGLLLGSVLFFGLAGLAIAYLW